MTRHLTLVSASQRAAGERQYHSELLFEVLHDLLGHF